VTQGLNTREGGLALVEDNGITEAETGQIEDVETLQQALAEEKERADKYLANWQRSQADFANYKQRAEQDRCQTIEYANSTLISTLLPVIDDLERAIAAVPPELAESSWTAGITLIYNKLKAILEAQGLTEIETRGEPFDPRIHEAVMQRKGEEGMVVEETQKGYRFKEKVIRPSLVVVGKGITKRKTEQSTHKEKEKWEEP
jgi:molecular chaperone GrpE